MQKVLVVVVTALTLAVHSAIARQDNPAATSTPAVSTVAPQRWKGVISIRNIKLDFGVVLQPGAAGAAPTGTMDIPLQGVKAAALSAVSISSEELRFTLALPGSPRGNEAVFLLKIEGNGQSASGELRQAGVTAPVTADRVPDGEELRYGPARPQDPKPPFPYRQRDVKYRNAKDGTALEGTLTVPAGPGPFPAVVLITGSGPQDRDESILGHRPFLVIADHLSRHGIAVLRSDDRGVGKSGGSVSEAVPEDSAGDVLAAIELLKTQPEIDGARIGVIGHSEGGIIGPLAASESSDVAFVVMLAGTGLKGRDILTMQSEAILLAARVNPAAVSAVTARHRALMDLIEAGAPREQIEAGTRELVKAQVDANMSVVGPSAAASDAQIDEAVKQQTAALDSKWFRAFLFYDPRPALRRVKVPVLALNGSLDVQVPPKENLTEIEKALKEGGNVDVTIREMPGLNHLFQTAITGGPSEYAEIQETFAPAALALVTEWITSRTSPGARK